MIINDLDFFLVEIPTRRTGVLIKSLLVRISTHNGYEGWGETQLKWHADELHHRRDRLLNAISGRSIFDIEDLVRIDELRNPQLRWGIETACWDLIGKLTSQPVCHFFGGEYRHRIPLVARLHGDTPDEFAVDSMELFNQGFHWQVIPLSGNLEQDRRFVRAVHESIGHRVELRIDGMCRFSEEDAIILARDWEDLGIGMWVDPLMTNDVNDLMKLQNQTIMQIGVRRAIRTPSDILAIVRGNTSLLPVIEPPRIGSIHETCKCAAVAEAADLRVALANSNSLGPSAAAMLQLAAALPACSGGNEGLVTRPREGILRDGDAFDVNDGLVLLPSGPGLGVELDRSKIDRFLVS